MCRFTLYMGPPILLRSLITEPAHSLIHQSFRSQERDEPLNGDGFGVAWYAPSVSHEPAVFRSVSPAWNNSNLLSLARVVKSPCVLAHVRAATRIRSVAEENCHPFSWGRYALMHNGDVGGFAGLRRRLLEQLADPAFESIRGSTDSEHLFALFIDELLAGGEPDAQRPDAASVMADALERAMGRILELSRRHGSGETSYLNIAVSDGQNAVITRYTSAADEPGESLYVNSGKRYKCTAGVCSMVEPDAGGGAVLVSSEPLSSDPSWSVVERNTMLVIDASQRMSQRRL